jgi:hypothetical protein
LPNITLKKNHACCIKPNLYKKKNAFLFIKKKKEKREEKKFSIVLENVLYFFALFVKFTSL